MLTPGHIPDQEPLLRVGVVLPEDDYTSLTLHLPADEYYQIEFSGRKVLPAPDSTMFFKLSAGELKIGYLDENFTVPNILRIFSIDDKPAIAPARGIRVSNVISGRSFHWKKYINVILPGTIEIKKHDGRLVLINELPLEHYLMCVATSEMGAACPPALIEAQTIAARSWMLANIEQKHRALGMDVCNDDCCQRYQGSTNLTPQSIAGARNTSGQVLMWQKTICDARYSKSCGGVMETFDTIWGGTNLPYTVNKADAPEEPAQWIKPLSEEDNFKHWVNSVPDTYCGPGTVPEDTLQKYLGSVDEQGSYFRWQEKLTQKGLCSNLNDLYAIDCQRVTEIIPERRGLSGRLNRVAVQYLDNEACVQTLILDSEYKIRQGLHKKFLYSSAFTVEKIQDEDTFLVTGAGWGHGVGLCQIGALGMALKGFTTEEILQHYYPGSELQTIY